MRTPLSTRIHEVGQTNFRAMVAGRQVSSCCAHAGVNFSLQQTAAHLQPATAYYPLAGLHPLRNLSTVVQAAIAQAQGGTSDQDDSFVGGELHKKLSKPISFTDPDARSMQQGCAEWHRARRQRVTASSVARATGLLPMFAKPGKSNPPQRTQLWMEMLGLSDRFQGNKATYWGTQNERRAIQKFAMHVNTSQLYHCGFDVLQDVDKYGRMRSWVGASPDGLLLPEAPDGKLQQGNYDDRPVSNLLLDVHDNRMKGVLEVKCPYNLRDSGPYKAWPEYYLPQVLTNMAVFRAQYAYMVCWTPHGLSLFHVEKHQAFWDGLIEALEVFWFQHYLPAQQLVAAHPDVDKRTLARWLHELVPGAYPENQDLLQACCREMHQSVQHVGTV